MRKVITFLGMLNENAKPVTYCYNQANYSGYIFAEALQQFCPYDMMLICVTEGAQERTIPFLQRQSKILEDPRSRVVPIPTGNDSSQMWETFKIITDEVNEGDHVVFDITHGLRSIPFLVFLFAAYLKTAKNVSIDAIYYGALELKPRDPDGVAPVIDLSEFSAMLDWITATNQFIQGGNGSELARLISLSKPPVSALRGDPVQQSIRNQLDKMSHLIDQTSQALSLARPLETMDKAGELQERLNLSEVAVSERAKPFEVLAEKIRMSYAPFALEKNLEPRNLKTNLWVQYDIVAWYLQKQSFVQAATLARELVVSVALAGLDETDLVDYKGVREPVENALNNYTKKDWHSSSSRETHYTEKDIVRLDKSRQLAHVWDELTQLRNDIAHVGMRKNPRTTASLINSLKKLQPQIERFMIDVLGPRNQNVVEK
jgi:CRISPR-associated Csx2 family protein